MRIQNTMISMSSLKSDIVAREKVWSDYMQSTTYLRKAYLRTNTTSRDLAKPWLLLCIWLSDPSSIHHPVWCSLNRPFTVCMYRRAISVAMFNCITWSVGFRAFQPRFIIVIIIRGEATIVVGSHRVCYTILATNHSEKRHSYAKLG